MVATLVARSANEAMMGSGGICVWRKFIVWSQAVGFLLVQESGVSRREDVITFNFVRKEI
jgi:hypothetical protein